MLNIVYYHKSHNHDYYILPTPYTDNLHIIYSRLCPYSSNNHHLVALYEIYEIRRKLRTLAVAYIRTVGILYGKEIRRIMSNEYMNLYRFMPRDVNDLLRRLYKHSKIL